MKIEPLGVCGIESDAQFDSVAKILSDLNDSGLGERIIQLDLYSFNFLVSLLHSQRP
jgi:hypothetical protein